jgi:hypothetical protein
LAVALGGIKVAILSSLTTPKIQTILAGTLQKDADLQGCRARAKFLALIYVVVEYFSPELGFTV